MASLGNNDLIYWWNIMYIQNVTFLMISTIDNTRMGTGLETLNKFDPSTPRLGL